MRTGTLTVNPDTPESYIVELAEGEVLQIGRKPASGGIKKLVLPYPEVSGQHSEIRCKTEGWTIIDAGSTNGTMLNGGRLTPGKEYHLHSGDRVKIAQYELLVNPPEFDHPNQNDDNDDSQDRTQFRIQMMNATILVGDIKGFTSLMEDHATQPMLVMEAAQKVFDNLNDEINKNYGQLEKIAGDAIMAYWQGNDAKSGGGLSACQACFTALKLKILTLKLAADKKVWPFENHPLMLDMALATGPVASGNLGSNASNPALLGDTANLVFRLEKLIGDDRPGDVIVEGATYELAKDNFKFDFLGQFNVKGRQKPVDVYRLIAPLS
ncbi:MAG: adenylate/guanylate cyclase domain-containing protein [Candidatus Melainabacteria bacterium]|jgi:class 3 adenylate cyclase|nr:adenylate/guanylate cyclase domain-containing protein [Candidatus Melainabacteria bacterium]